jgi:XTP/dITP diphosphohydrolase
VRELLVATNNLGKQREFTELLASLPAKVLFPTDLGLRVKVEETGSTYAENAELKAQEFCRASGLIALGDDSGLEVDALGGAPGLRSARYTVGSDLDRLTALLDNLSQTPEELRTARFRCVVAIATPTGENYTTEGVCEGIITLKPAGSGGFGYDPIFYIPDQGRTMAELEPAVKNRISHRARAVHAAMDILKKLLVE